MTRLIRFDAEGLPLQDFSCPADVDKTKKSRKTKTLNTDCLRLRSYLSVDLKQVRRECTHSYATFCRG
jgi:hypothetical protein